MKNEITGMRLRLIVMNFLQFAVWGAYLTSMGTYLFNIGLGAKIGLFYAMQGIVSLFMPAIMGIIADRWGFFSKSRFTKRRISKGEMARLAVDRKSVV